MLARPPPSPSPSPTQEAPRPCPGRARCASSRSLWPGGFRGEPGRESLGGFLGGAGPAMPAGDATQGGRVPSPLNLPYRASVMKNTPAPPGPAPGRVAHRVGGGQRSAGAGRVRRVAPGAEGVGMREPAPPTLPRRPCPPPPAPTPPPPPSRSSGPPARWVPRAWKPWGRGRR